MAGADASIASLALLLAQHGQFSVYRLLTWRSPGHLPQVFLISKAGTHGINLVSCRRIVVLEEFFNPVYNLQVGCLQSVPALFGSPAGCCYWVLLLGAITVLLHTCLLCHQQSLLCPWPMPAVSAFVPLLFKRPTRRPSPACSATGRPRRRLCTACITTAPSM